MAYVKGQSLFRSSWFFLLFIFCLNVRTGGNTVLGAHQQLFTDLVEFVRTGRHQRMGCYSLVLSLTHTQPWQRRTSAEAKDVTSMRFSARNAKTAAARTEREGVCSGTGLQNKCKSASNIVKCESHGFFHLR